MVGFHYAYYFLDAGIGAIILFGGVQIIMFSSAIISKENPSIYNWLGMTTAMIGIYFIPSRRFGLITTENGLM